MLDKQVTTVATQLLANPRLMPYVNASLPIPHAYRGQGVIKLVILGQDPTVKNPESLAKIKVVLNLSGKGGLWNYLARICLNLGLKLSENVYATNYLKNFFIMPPTQIHNFDAFGEFSRLWLPVLKNELVEFAGLPVIALGQPLLTLLRVEPAKALVREYWGYVPGWKAGVTGPLSHLQPHENVLERVVFPFPHQPSIMKEFYRQRLETYCDYVAGAIGRY